MKSLEEQISFVDKKLLPFFGFKNICDYDYTFKFSTEIDLDSFNELISEIRKVFPVKEFSLHKINYKVSKSNQALCILKKSLDLIQLPYTVETIVKNKISFKQMRLIRTNIILHNYIKKMTEIRTFEETNKMNFLENPTNEIQQKQPTLENEPKKQHLYAPPGNDYVPSYDYKPQKTQKFLLTENDLQHFKKEIKMTLLFMFFEKTINNNECEFVIDLKHYNLIDKYVNSIKCKFSYNRETQNGENILNNILNSKYEILISEQVIYSETFCEDKELLPNTQLLSTMLLPIRVLYSHDVKLKIKLSFNSIIGYDIFNYFGLTMCVNTVHFYDNVDEKLLYMTYPDINNISCGTEQTIINEKNEYNIFRTCYGMGANAYNDFIEKEKFLQYMWKEKFLQKGEEYVKRLNEKDVIRFYEIGEKIILKGYESKNLHVPKGDYDFNSCVTNKIYKNNEPNFQYSIITNDEGKHIHTYEMMIHYNLCNENVREHVGFYKTPDYISDLCISFSHKKFINKENIKLYFLLLDFCHHLSLDQKVKFVTNDKMLQKKNVEFEMKFNECESKIEIKTKQHVFVCGSIQCIGFLLEYTNDTEENKLENIDNINVSCVEYIFSKNSMLKLRQS